MRWAERHLAKKSKRKRRILLEHRRLLLRGNDDAMQQQQMQNAYSMPILADTWVTWQTDTWPMQWKLIRRQWASKMIRAKHEWVEEK
jgi:hypothetical protein